MPVQLDLDEDMLHLNKSILSDDEWDQNYSDLWHDDDDSDASSTQQQMWMRRSTWLTLQSMLLNSISTLNVVGDRSS